MPAKRRLGKAWLAVLIFVVGLGIAVYPLISRFYYRLDANSEVAVFESSRQKLPDEEIAKRLELARAYNEILDPSKLGDPYTEAQREGIAEYARMLELEEKIGHIEIAKIGEDLPIYAGTSDSVLQRGAGHLEGTSLPIGGASTHTVITAHRGPPTAKLFTDLNKLEIGDRFYIHNLAGVLAYQVDQILTVEPSDFEPVMVVEGEDLATLLTCTPYMINSHRLLVRGHRVPFVAAFQEQEIAANRTSRTYQYLFYAALAALLLVVLWLLLRFLKKRRKKREAA